MHVLACQLTKYNTKPYFLLFYNAFREAKATVISVLLKVNKIFTKIAFSNMAGLICIFDGK